ncbi:hypothetical protein ZOSMA_761G00010 [Zostera marina]|uniref:Uncharacterized protein n=1 Tax=Zostera marina TaxID=29655 RepID=A0A0K9NR61_ZOSMR|nr:hypothetical protein ZOSMA_761G00010 [Zostera marina]
MSLMNEMDVDSSKEENENSDDGADHSDSIVKNDSSDSNDEKKKKMIAKGKKPMVEEKNEKKKKNTNNEVKAVKIMSDAIKSIDKEQPRILVKKKATKKKKIYQSPIRRSTRLSSGKSDSACSLNTTEICLAKVKKTKDLKKVRFDKDAILVEEGVESIGSDKSKADREKDKSDAIKPIDEKKASDDVGKTVEDAVGEQTDILTEEETRQATKDADIENVDALNEDDIATKEDDSKPLANDDIDTVNDDAEANNVSIVDNNDRVDTEQLDVKNENNVRQVEVAVEKQTMTKDAEVHDDKAKVANAAMVHTKAAMVHTDAVAGEEEASMEKPKEEVKISFTPPTFNLQLHVTEKKKSEAGKYDSEAVKAHSKDVNVSSVEPNVSYKGGHVTYEANKEPFQLPSYVVKGEGSTNYPTMMKVKEELYEAWELKIKDNENKDGNAVTSTSNRVDLTKEDDCNPADKDPKEASLVRPDGKDIPDFLKLPTYFSSQEDPAFLEEACVLADKAEKAKIFLEKMRDVNKGDNILKRTREWNARERKTKENKTTPIKQIVTTIIDIDEDLDNVLISSR